MANARMIAVIPYFDARSGQVWFLVMRTVLFCLLAVLGQLTLAAERIKDFDGLMKSLLAGEDVRIVIEYKKMKMLVEGKEEEAPDATGGAAFDTWEHFARGVVRNERAYVATSHAVLIEIRSRGRLYNYGKIRVFEDGEVEVLVQYWKPDTFEVTMDELFKGRISQGDDEHGVGLFTRR